MDGNKIMCECHADTLTVMRLMGLSRINHKQNAQEVLKGFQDSHYKTGIAIGVIDKDKRLPKGIRDFELVKEESGIVLLKKPEFKHYLITIDPAIERFLLDSAYSVDVDPEQYKIPSSIKKLTRITKNKHLDQNDNFKQFLNTLIQKKPPKFRQLKAQIELPFR